MFQSSPLSIIHGTYELPLPQADRGGRERGSTGYPFETLALNGWFSVPNRAGSTVRKAIGRWYQNHGREKKFVQRIGPNGYPTVWRVK